VAGKQKRYAIRYLSSTRDVIRSTRDSPVTTVGKKWPAGTENRTEYKTRYQFRYKASKFSFSVPDSVHHSISTNHNPAVTFRWIRCKAIPGAPNIFHVTRERRRVDFLLQSLLALIILGVIFCDANLAAHHHPSSYPNALCAAETT
jgi:hypothetical protein